MTKVFRVASIWIVILVTIINYIALALVEAKMLQLGERIILGLPDADY